MQSAMKKALIPVMHEGNRRLDGLGNSGLDGLLILAWAIAVLGVVLGGAGGYHAGFVPLHGLLGSLLPNAVWAFITRFGDERVLLLLTLLFARRRPEVFWAMVLATLFAILYARSLKHLVDALRPAAVLPADMLHVIGPVLHSHSFPSGHTTSVFVFAGVLFAFARKPSERAALIVFASLVGLSRVAVGAHWPQDVIAGAFGGPLASVLGVWLARFWRAGLRPEVHLALLLLPLIAMPWLMLSSNGNPSVPWLIWPLMFAMTMQLVLDYRVYTR